MQMYRREHYLAKLRPFYDDAGLIKVVTGIRRCGKSSLLCSVMDELRERGVSEGNICYINLDRREYQDVNTPEKLDAVIEHSLGKSVSMRYLFIDEIQNVKGYETIVNGWREEGDCSIFITGSNSYLLSGELATKLTGRYIELEMFTLSFNEYLGMREYLGLPKKPESQVFQEYLTYGGFPKALEYEDLDAKAMYIQDVQQRHSRSQSGASPRYFPTRAGLSHQQLCRSHESVGNRRIFETQRRRDGQT